MKYNFSGTRISFVSFGRQLIIVLLCFGFFHFTSGVSAAETDVEQVAADVRQAVKQAKKLLRKGDLTAAETVLRPVIEADPKAYEAKLVLAYVFLKQRKIVEAYDLSYDTAKNDPKNARAFSTLASVMLMSGKFKDAKATVHRAFELDHNDALAWATYGLLNFYENNFDVSLNALNEAIFNDPNEPDYVFAYGQVAARAEHYAEAAAAYRKYLGISHNNDVERRERIKGLISFLTYLGNKTSLYNSVGKDQTSVSFSLNGNRPLINLKINGSDEILHFVLDTGSNISVISTAASEKMKIKPVAQGGSANGIGGDGRFPIVYGFLNSIEIGDIRVKNVPIYIRSFHHTSDEIDGYIGLALISKFLTVIDYGDSTLSLTKRNTSTVGKISGNEEFSLPLRQTPSGFLSGEVRIQGIEPTLNFIVDTGASISVVSNDLADTKEFNEIAKGENMSVTGAAGISRDVPSFLLPRLSFGKNSRDSIRAVSLDLDLINENSGFEQSGILGGNFLKNYRLIFDFENSKVIFEPVREK